MHRPRASRVLLWTGGILLCCLVVIVGGSFFADAPLRAYIERDMNRSLKDYTAHIGKLHFHPIGFSLDLLNLTISQDARPDPPVLRVPELHASVHWEALLRGRLVADSSFTRPEIYVSHASVEREAKSPVPLKERGWQQALESIYPLKINVLTISEWKLTYVDRAPFKPLQLSHVHFRATNIRNVWSPARVCPSDFHLDGQVFDAGHITADGHANFLAEPHVGLQTDLLLKNVDLNYFAPITNRHDVSVQEGVLTLSGYLEYMATGKTISKIKDLTVDKVRVDYTHTAAQPAPSQAATKAAQKTKEASNKPNLEFHLDRMQIQESEIGIINKTTSPNYRLFFSEANVTLTNLSNQSRAGVSTLEATGLFMGTGKTTGTGTFRPETTGPSLDVKAAIVGTQMPPMNDMVRAYANVDVQAGEFSLYSELTVKDKAIQGYVKPLFKDLVVPNQQTEKQKSLPHKLYETVVKGLTSILKNKPRNEVATQTLISGTLDNPQTSLWTTIVNLLQNAFFKSILPGFERQAKER